MTFFGNRVIAAYKIRSYWSREFLIQYDLCSYRRHRKERWPHTDRDIKGECHMRMEREVGVTQFKTKGCQYQTVLYEKLRKRHRTDSFLEASRELGSTLHLDLTLLAYTLVKEYISVVLSHPYCDTLL